MKEKLTFNVFGTKKQQLKHIIGQVLLCLLAGVCVAILFGVFLYTFFPPQKKVAYTQVTYAFEDIGEAQTFSPKQHYLKVQKVRHKETGQMYWMIHSYDQLDFIPITE